MIRLVKAVDTAECFADRDALIVDLLGVADHAGDGAEAAGDAHRAGIGEGRQPAVEHARVEFVRLAVDIDIAAREVRPHQRMAARHDAGDQFVDKGVLGAAQGRQIKPRRQEEFARIDAAAMGRVEQDGATAFARLKRLERGIEFVLDFQHGARSVPEA